MNCEQPFWQDLNILFRPFTLQYQPKCIHSQWNFLIRILIISLCIGMIGSIFGGLAFIPVVLLFGIITASIIIYYTPIVHDQQIPIENVQHEPYIAPITEHFINGGFKPNSILPYEELSGIIEIDAHPFHGAPLPEQILPSARNPFMNILIDDIKYNPTRSEASSSSSHPIKQSLDEYFRIQWYSDPTDVFGKNQSQRQYVTQPSTTVPNDQGSFANWLYKIPGKTCKEGGKPACHGGTDGGAIPWLNI